MKRCYSCKKERPLSEFPVNRKRADGRGSMCKDCKKSYNATYYADTKDRHNPARAARRDELKREARQNLAAYLLDHPCVDCGEHDIIVLQFDHQGDKVAEISDMVTNGCTWERILTEIAKCEVVCANDHLRRTARTGGWHKLTVASALVSLMARAADS